MLKSPSLKPPSVVTLPNVTAPVINSVTSPPDVVHPHWDVLASPVLISCPVPSKSAPLTFTFPPAVYTSALKVTVPSAPSAASWSAFNTRFKVSWLPVASPGDPACVATVSEINALILISPPALSERVITLGLSFVVIGPVPVSWKSKAEDKVISFPEVTVIPPDRPPKPPALFSNVPSVISPLILASTMVLIAISPPLVSVENTRPASAEVLIVVEALLKVLGANVPPTVKSPPAVWIVFVNVTSPLVSIEILPPSAVTGFAIDTAPVTSISKLPPPVKIPVIGAEVLPSSLLSSR